MVSEVIQLHSWPMRRTGTTAVVKGGVRGHREQLAPAQQQQSQFLQDLQQGGRSWAVPSSFLMVARARSRGKSVSCALTIRTAKSTRPPIKSTGAHTLMGLPLKLSRDRTLSYSRNDRMATIELHSFRSGA